MKNRILEDHGYFWWHSEPVPEKHFAPPSSITGILTIDEDGRTRLELNGLLPTGDKTPHFSAIFGDEKPIPADTCTQGILKGNNKYVLLSELTTHGGRLSSNGISYSGYQALNCFVGDSVFPSTKKPLRFRSFKIDMEEEWLRLGSIELKRTKSSIAARHKRQKPSIY